MHIHEEASAVKNSDRGWQSPSLVDWSQEGCHHSVPHLGEGLSSCKTQGLYQIMYLLWGGTKTLFSLHYYLTALSLFLCSFVSLRSLITEIYPRASTVTRLRSQKWLRPKWLLLCQEKFSFSRAPQYICLHSDFILYVRASAQLGIESRLGGQILSNDWLMAECRVGKVHRDRKKEC